MGAQWALVRTDTGVAVRGEIDLATADDFREQLRAAADKAAGTFLIDLSEVTFMDSSAVRALMLAVAAAPQADVVVRASRPTFTILHVFGLTRGAWTNVVVIPPPEDDADPMD